MVRYSDANTRIKALRCRVLFAHRLGLQVRLRVLESRSVCYEEPLGTGSQWVTKEFHRDQEITVNGLAVQPEKSNCLPAEVCHLPEAERGSK